MRPPGAWRVVDGLAVNTAAPGAGGGLPRHPPARPPSPDSERGRRGDPVASSHRRIGEGYSGWVARS